MSRIVIAGSHDSKPEPHRLLVRLLAERGETPIVIDTAVYPNDADADFPAAVVAQRAGCEHGSIADKGRADAVQLMATGAARIVSGLAGRGEVGAVVCMGGSNAATLFRSLVAAVPLGIPKIIMGTTLAGDVRPIVSASDVVMIYSVVDVEGSNAILDTMIERLADTAVALKSNQPFTRKDGARRTIAMSMYGVTTPCVQQVARHVEKAGMEPMVFHANGTGGNTIEKFAAQNLVDGIVDATIAELGNEVIGGAFAAGADRFSGAARHGIPQVIAPGALDMIAFGARNTVPRHFEDHKIIAHNALVTLVRTTRDECRSIGQRLGERLGAPGAATTLCVPAGGTSMLDKDGGEFSDPPAVDAFQAGFEETADASIRIVRSEANINDPDFAELMFDALQQNLSEKSADRANGIC
ncbi:Tm-1-like ATP-binding domain-containing protein [Hoeflea sp.]|uniref:Tm-1-like ATP-binding domain-containing protein n=1 Tax=Hoeflea sp. TaxID=1940281 RepID=UPI003B028C30